MITITKQNDGVLFTFQDSDKYLYGNGTILVPFNSLSIIADESDMITLKKAAANDVFLSARYDTDLGYRSKDDAIDDLKGMLFAETGGGSGSGVTPSEVQEMIDESISGKADASALTSHADNVNVHFSGTQKSNYDGLEAQYYVDDNWDVMPMSVFNDFTNDYSMAMGQFDQRISANESAIATKADTSAVTAVANDVQTVSGQVQTKVATSDFNAYSAATATALGNKQDALEYYEENTEDGWAEMRVATDDGDGNTSDQHISIGGGLEIGNYQEYNDGQGNTGFTSTNIQFNNPEINMYAESEDNGETETTYFNITPLGVNINDERVLTEGDVTSAITSASTNSEVAGAKAVYDAIQAGGGGGATYSAGTNISIDTANTINCTLPISKTGNDSVLLGKGNYMSIGSNVQSSVIAGNSVTAATGSHYSLAVGNNLHISNPQETSTGYWNKTSNSSSNFGNSGNTLVSFGNGMNQNTMHNALEIRQNGDIYFPDTDNTTYSNYYQKPMVRLQDMYAALGGLKLVKLTQAEYDALATKDANTLYIISNVVS